MGELVMELFYSLLDEPLFLLFIILFIGSMVGQVKLKGLSLGT